MEDTKYPCLLIAGEKSGEDHALSFIPGLKEKLPDLTLFGVGGDSLQKIGMTYPKNSKFLIMFRKNWQHSPQHVLILIFRFKTLA